MYKVQVFFYTVISIFLKLIICASENFKWQNLMQSVRSGHIDSFFTINPLKIN